MHPYLLHSGHLLLPTFGVLAALGLMAALTLSLRTAPTVGLDPDKLWNAGLFTLLSAFALSRLLLIVTNLHNFIAYPVLLLMVPSLNPLESSSPSSRALSISASAVSHSSTPSTPGAPAPPLIWAFLALGHFAEGSDAGLPTTLPWGIRHPARRTPVSTRSLSTPPSLRQSSRYPPPQLRSRHHPGDTAALALATAGTLQFLLTFFRQPYPYTSRQLHSPRPHPVDRTRYDRRSRRVLVSAATKAGHPCRLRTCSPRASAAAPSNPSTAPPAASKRPPRPLSPSSSSTSRRRRRAVRTFTADPAAANLRLDHYLAQALPDISRARVQLLIEAGQVRVDGNPAKPKQKLHGGESIEIEGSPQPAPLHATPEDIPLDILHEDKHLAVVNKPAGMMVHAGAGTTDDARNRGTLVNALLFHFTKLSDVGGDLRPGIVHRLDKQTSGLILVAKDDSTHRKLGEMFSRARSPKPTSPSSTATSKKTTPPSPSPSLATSSAAPA